MTPLTVCQHDGALLSYLMVKQLIVEKKKDI